MKASLLIFFLSFFCVVFFGLITVRADDPPTAPRLIEVRYTPTARAQTAIWVENSMGEFIATLRLTEAVAYRGIGNRPGGTQMNSGFRWPYGRREGVLPIWAHRRASAPGAELFPRVIFQDRTSEGYASRTSTDFSEDNYFCLSFATAAADDLDAISCASVFNSDKGRFITEQDVNSIYSEPWQNSPGDETTRPLSLESYYPPRRDILELTGYDHEDVAFYREEALRVMPDIDVVTAATAAADTLQILQIDVPDNLPDGDYVLYVEVNTEKDHNETWSEEAYPTPQSSRWDYWAKSYGFAYRGQPSVLYAVPFTLSKSAMTSSTSIPEGYSDIHGENGEVHPLDDTISDDPINLPGSGADRLRSMEDGSRLTVEVIPTSICQSDDPPAECGVLCEDDSDCAEDFLCEEDNACTSLCEANVAPSDFTDFSGSVYPEESHSHEWARLKWTAIASRRKIVRYDIRVSTTPLTTEEEFFAAVNAKAASNSLEAVNVCDSTSGDIVCPQSGSEVEIDIGWLDRLTTYYIGIRAYDECGVASSIATTIVDMTDIHFTTVSPSPCFVATAAYGSPMANEVHRLRHFRNQHLMTSSTGRFFVRTYYHVGPYLAAWIRGHEVRKLLARTLLTPMVDAVQILDRWENR